MGSLKFFKKFFKIIKVLFKLCFIVAFIILFLNYWNLQKEYYNIKRIVTIIEENNNLIYSEFIQKYNDSNSRK